MTEILLYIFCGFAFLAASFMLFTRNILYSALALAVVLISVAGLFVLMQSEFVGVAQIMIYAGGIIVLILFAIMLTTGKRGERPLSQKKRVFPALILGAALFSMLALQVYHLPVDIPGPSSSEPIKSLGITMLTDFLIPLELIAVLLLVVLIGALTIARNYFKRNPGKS
jgi:NADH-quinone oxidoreductase subunit J